MKRLVNYIKNLFSAHSEHRTKNFRKQFEAAYPDAAEFVSKIKAIDRKKRVYQLPYSIVVDGSITAGKTREDVLAEIYADALSEYTSGRLEIRSRKDPAENKSVD